MERENVYPRFVHDTSGHVLTVLRDDGIYRHLRFARKNTNAYYFDLVTWPGYLAMTGDMGTWTFSRVNDMFRFFRDEDAERINPGYWSEKLQAGSGSGRDDLCYEFDEEAFHSGLQNWFDSYYEDADSESQSYIQAKDAIDGLKSESYSDEREASQAVYDAYLPDDISSWDIIEGLTLKKYTFHYLWACHAIVWGIQKFDTRQLITGAMDKFFAMQISSAAEREQVPVAWIHLGGPFGGAVTRSLSVANSWKSKGDDVTDLFTGPQKPVVVLADCDIGAVSHMAHWYSEEQCEAWVAGAEYVRKQVEAAGITVKGGE